MKRSSVAFFPTRAVLSFREAREGKMSAPSEHDRGKTLAPAGVSERLRKVSGATRRGSVGAETVDVGVEAASVAAEAGRSAGY